MRLALFALSAIACVTSSSALRAADDAAAIIDKSIKAYGGAEKIAAAKAEQWSSKGNIEIMGMKMEYTGQFSFQEPDSFRFEIESSIGGQKFSFMSGTDGKSYWQKMGDKSEEMVKKKADAFRNNVYSMHLRRLLPLKEKGHTLSVTGEEKIDGKPAIGILVSSKGHSDVTLFFDKESSLIVKALTETWDEFNDKNVSQEAFFSNYKDKDGRKIFTKLTLKHDGKPFLEEELTDQKQSAKFDAKHFAKP